MSSITPTSNKKHASARRRHSGDTNSSVSRSIAAPFQDDSVLIPSVLGTFDSIRASDGGFPAHKKIKPLQELSKMTFDRYCGPTPESNWVIPGSLLVGAYPASQSDEETFDLISAILKSGISSFVCLQQEYRATGVTEAMWRSGAALRPYFQDVQYLVRVKDKIPEFVDHNIVDCEDLKFIHFPIKDCDITDDARVLDLAKSLVKSISDGDVLYLHCWGGHGRTGTVVCIMLHLMYGLNAVASMAYCQYVHDLRRCPVVVGSPQTQSQRDQVKRVIEYLESHNPSQQGEDPIRTPTNLSPPRTPRASDSPQAPRDNIGNGNGAMVFSLSPRNTPQHKPHDCHQKQQQQAASVSQGDSTLTPRDIHTELEEAVTAAGSNIMSEEVNKNPSHALGALPLSSIEEHAVAGVVLRQAVIPESSGAEMDIGSASKIGIVQKSDEFRSSLLVDIPALNQISCDAMDISPVPSPVMQNFPSSSPRISAFNNVESMLVGEANESDAVSSIPLLSRPAPSSPSPTLEQTVAYSGAHNSALDAMPLESDAVVVEAEPAFFPASFSASTSLSRSAQLALPRVGSNRIVVGRGEASTASTAENIKISSQIARAMPPLLRLPPESKPTHRQSFSDKGLVHPPKHGPLRHIDVEEERSISHQSFSRSLPHFEEDASPEIVVGSLSSPAKAAVQLGQQRKRNSFTNNLSLTPDTVALSINKSPVSSRRVQPPTATTPMPQSPVTPRSSAMSFLGSLRMMTGLGGGGSSSAK